MPGDCGQRTTAFLTAVQSSKYPLGYFVGGAVLYLFPAVIGAFWGAPLISRELEAGTFRLAWNQSVTRTRWTLVKLALVGLTAMAITLVLFAGLLYALPAFVLPHLATPVTQIASVTPDLTRDQVLPSGEVIVADNSLPGAWIISNQTVTPSGQVFIVPQSSDSAFASACANPAQAECTAWFAGQHLRRQISYQPASRFWQLQAEETGILLAISLALAAAATWRIRHYHP